MGQVRRDEEPVDVSMHPDLLRLTEEVLNTGRPRVLGRGGEAVAMIVPLAGAPGKHHAKRELSPEDIKAFRAAAGSWADIDVDRFLSDEDAARDVPDERRSLPDAYPSPNVIGN